MNMKRIVPTAVVTIAAQSEAAPSTPGTGLDYGAGAYPGYTRPGCKEFTSCAFKGLLDLQSALSAGMAMVVPF